MRIALISDPHGNLDCLDAVLADLDRTGGADRICCLGDLCFGGPEPVATLHRIRELCHEVVLGNHDLDLVCAQRRSQRTGWERDHLDRTLAGLADDDLAWLRSLTVQRRCALPDGGDLRLFHALPDDPDWPERQELAPGGPAVALADPSVRLHAGGHTHIQTLIPLPDGSLFINPGSVAIPLAVYPVGPEGPRFVQGCHYAILDLAPGSISVDFRRLPWPASMSVCPDQ